MAGPKGPKAPLSLNKSGADIKVPELSSKPSKPLQDMGKDAIESLIRQKEVTFNALKNSPRSTDRAIAELDLAKLKEYHRDRFEPDKSTGLVHSAGGDDIEMVNPDDVQEIKEDGLLSSPTEDDLGMNASSEAAFSDPFAGGGDINITFDGSTSPDSSDLGMGDLQEYAGGSIEDALAKGNITKEEYDFFKDLEEKEKEKHKDAGGVGDVDMWGGQVILTGILNNLIAPSDPEKGVAKENKIKFLREDLEPGELVTIGPFHLLRENESDDSKVFVILDYSEDGGTAKLISLNEENIESFAELARKNSPEGSMITSEAIAQEGLGNLLEGLTESKVGKLKKHKSAAEVAVDTVKEVETHKDLVAQKEKEASETHQRKLDEVTEALEHGGFSIPHMDAFKELGGKIFKEDGFGYCRIKKDGKWNQLGRNQEIVLSGPTSEWPEEIDVFKKPRKEHEAVCRAKFQGEWQFLTRDGGVLDFTEAVVGEDGIVEDMTYFEEVGIEREYGIREVKFGGKLNLLNEQNQLIYRANSKEWLDEVRPFKRKNINRPDSGEPVKTVHYDEERGGEPIAGVKVKGVYKFLTLNGEFFEADMDTIAIYQNDDDWSEIKMPAQIEVPEVQKDIPEYIDRWITNLTAQSKRFRQDELIYTPLCNLIEEIRVLREGNGDLDWKTALISMKRKVEGAGLPNQLMMRLTSRLIGIADIKSVHDPEFDLSIGELDKYDHIPYDYWDGGMVAQIDLDGKTKYTLADKDRNLLYKEPEFFDNFGRFNGQVAWVERNGKINFIFKETGGLLIKDEHYWFIEIYGPHAGLFLVRREGDKKYNYINSEGKPISTRWFEDARSFSEKEQIANVVLDGEEIVIDTDGKRVISVIGKLLMLFRSSKQIPPGLAPKGPPSFFSRGEIPSGVGIPAMSMAIPKPECYINHQLHRLFQNLFEEHPKDSSELIRAYCDFQKVLSKATDELGVATRPDDIRGISIKLKAYAATYKLSDGAYYRLVNFILLNLRKEETQWDNIAPLSISLLMSFNGLLTSCAEDDKEGGKNEKELIKVVREIEDTVNNFPIDARENLRKLSPKLKAIVFSNELESSIKDEVWQIVLNMMFSKSIYWNKGNSMDSYRPQFKPGKILQQMRTDVKHAPVELTVMEKARTKIKCDQLYNLAFALAKEGNCEEANLKHNELIQLNPKYPFPYTWFAVVISRKNMEMSVGFFESALFINPKDSRAHLYLGAIKQERGDMKGAQEHFENAHGIELEHESLSRDEAEELYKRLAKILNKNRRKGIFKIISGALIATTLIVGIKHAKDCIDVDSLSKAPDMPPPAASVQSSEELMTKGKMFLKSEQYEDAIKYLEELVKRNKKLPDEYQDFESQKLLLEAYRKAGRLDDLKRFMGKEGINSPFLNILTQEAEGLEKAMRKKKMNEKTKAMVTVKRRTITRLIKFLEKNGPNPFIFDEIIERLETIGRYDKNENWLIRAGKFRAKKAKHFPQNN